MVANLGLHGFYVGKRIGEADGASGDGSRDVEKRYADGGAASLALASLSLAGGHEFFSMGVILHGDGSGLRIGERSARGGEEGGTSCGGVSFPGGDLSAWMGRI